MSNCFKRINLDKSRLWYGLFFAVTFLFTFIFFTEICPIIVYDADDWLFASFSRPAVPMLDYWNPGRVFPEVFSSFCSFAGYWILNPFLNDPLQCLSLSYAFFVSVFVLIYIYRFTMLVKSRSKLSTFAIIIVSALFYVAHFLAFKNGASQNDYFFRSIDSTCYFFYTIPNLLCASIVMYFMEDESRFESVTHSLLSISFWIVVLYMAIYSNLFPTAILMSYFGYIILRDLFRSFPIKSGWVKEFLKSHRVILLTFAGWIVSCVFELAGGRAASKDVKSFSFVDAVKAFAHTVTSKVNLPFAVCAVGFLVLLAITVAIATRGKHRDESSGYFGFLGQMLFCGIVSTAFFIVLSAKVGSYYLERTEIIFSAFFYLVLIVSLSLVLLVKNFRAVKALLPVILIIAVSVTFTGNRVFLESNVSNIDHNKCRSVNNYIISQMKEADSKHQSKVELHVPLNIPMYDTDENWPHAIGFMGERIANTLYEYHVVNDLMKVELVPDENVNVKFGLPVPDTGSIIFDYISLDS